MSPLIFAALFSAALFAGQGASWYDAVLIGALAFPVGLVVFEETRR